MKGLRISLAMLVFVLAVNVYFYMYISSSTNEICELIDDMERMMNEGVLSEEIFLKISERTEKNIPVWQIVINHSETDNVTVTLDSLRGAVKNGDIYYGRVYLGSLRFYISNLFEREKLSLSNIF
ncbi:MAG: DUF4363 family protein [Eubacteriaceae bacterium]|nr:DUF4363 family protein [Eubacteriaceae bacterium]